MYFYQEGVFAEGCARRVLLANRVDTTLSLPLEWDVDYCIAVPTMSPTLSDVWLCCWPYCAIGSDVQQVLDSVELR